MKRIRTKAGAIRKYNAILRDYMRRNRGGGQWGFDWPTMAIVEPMTYRKLRALSHIHALLGA